VNPLKRKKLSGDSETLDNVNKNVGEEINLKQLESDVCNSKIMKKEPTLESSPPVKQHGFFCKAGKGS